MTPDQAAALVERIAATWRGRLSTAERNVWADALSDLDHHAAQIAVDRLAGTEAHRPSIAVIRLACPAAGADPDAAAAGERWQVLAYWTDTKGCSWTSQSWHTSEHEASAAYAEARWPGDHTKTVELLHHADWRPVEHIGQTTIGGAA